VSVSVVLLLALPGIAHADPPIKIPWGSGVSKGAIWYRDQFGITGGKNIAVVVYKYPNGQTGKFAMESVMPGPLKLRAADAIVGHSERRIGKVLLDAGIDPDSVTEVYTELQPCTYNHCGTWLGKNFSNAQVYYSYDYGDTRASRRTGIRDLKAAVKQRNTALKNGGDVMDPPGEGPEGGALTNKLANPTTELDPGGIDFSSLQLRYMSLTGPHRGAVRYAMDSDGAPVTKNPRTGLRTAQEDSSAFYTWLTLSPRSFWVNLEPNYPPRIIDPTFGRTDAGHVLLHSDLLLKEAGKAAENLADPGGAQLWQRMLALPAGSDTATGPCIAYRLWIVPDVATVRATKSQLYILGAPLKIKMATVRHLSGKLLDPICPSDAWNTTWQASFRQLIVPELTREVNTAPQFEPLRRVYMSRVAAQWVRNRASRRTVIGRLVNSGLHRRWVARPRWSSNAIWEHYIHLLDSPPTPYTIPVPQPDGSTLTYTVYATGGVDFSHRINEKNTSARQFEAHWRGLAAAAKRSTRHVSKGGGTTLFGAATQSGKHRKSHRRHQRVRPMRVPRGV
jgi:hypothetical protein